jgi:DNA-binding winged helix-turn-helix (wHTH) protein/energy-coupling factor transporter ATP-binding protein EcfA2
VTPKRQIIFGPFRFDTASEELFKGPERVSLRPKSLAVLRYLLDHPHQVIPKDELLGAIWNGSRVVEATLKVSIGDIRRALGGGTGTPKFIETVERKGYRFTAPLNVQVTGRNAGGPFIMVGRETELEQLQQHLEIANSGRRQMIFVTGEPGIGKTTLIEALAATLLDDGNVLVVQSQCIEQYGASEAYLPLIDAVEQLCLRDDMNALPILRRHAPSWLANLPSLIDSSERTDLGRQSLGIGAERRLREIARFLEAISADRTLLLVLEDLHWLDKASLNLVSYLARRTDTAKLMILGTYREGELEYSGHPLKQVKAHLELHRCCFHHPLAFLNKNSI